MLHVVAYEYAYTYHNGERVHVSDLVCTSNSTLVVQGTPATAVITTLRVHTCKTSPGKTVVNSGIKSASQLANKSSQVVLSGVG